MQTTEGLERELIRKLAELLCPKCGGSGWRWDRGGCRVNCRDCQDSNSNLTGLAFLWASEGCLHWGTDEGDTCPDCKVQAPDSGRVPKDVGLEELFEHGNLLNVGRYHGRGFRAEYNLYGTEPAFGETPLLAALRVVAQAQKEELLANS